VTVFPNQQQRYRVWKRPSITTACSAHGASLLLVLRTEHHYCLFSACLWVCSATSLTISSRFQIAGGSEDLHLMMVESHQPGGTLTKHTITHCILKQYWTVEIKCTKHCIPASSSVCKLQTDLTTAVVKYNEIYWNCLQCFHAVGWAAGRAAAVKNWVVGCWRGYLSAARCRLAYGPADVTATHCLLPQKNPDWFYLSGTCSPG